MSSLTVGDVPAAIVRIARPLHGDDELDQLLDLVSRARIVLLGESTHGTREFFELRARLTRKLFAQHGFTALAIEGDWPDAVRVDRYIRGHGYDESAEQALESFAQFPTWMWRNDEVARLVDWLRGYNRYRLPEERAGFYGLDVYASHASSRAALAYLTHVDPEAAAAARESYACFDRAVPGPPSAPARAREEDIVDELLEMQRRRAARSGRSPSGEAWLCAIQRARLARSAPAYYRAMLAGSPEAWNLREAHMADTVSLLSEQLARGGQPAKLIVWAHNAHVGDARATAQGAAGQLTLGQLLRERYPRELSLVGFTTHDGTVECAHDWGEAPGAARVRSSLPESWEGLFHEAGIPRFMVTSAALKRGLGERVERLHRAIGAVYRPETERRSHYYAARLADQYDLVVHVDTTRAVEPLAPTRAANA